MKRGLGFSGIKSLQPYKSPLASRSGALDTKMPSSSDSVAAGSLGTLKLAAEKLVREQATARKDLEIANAKLKKLMEQIHILEEKLRCSFNENTMLKVKQKEYEKVWKGVDSKFGSTKTLCDQLTGTLEQLINQVQDAEKDKAFLEDKMSAATAEVSELHKDMRLMTLRLDSSQETVKIFEKELRELRLAKEKAELHLRDEQRKFASLIQEKDRSIEQLEEAVAGDKMALEGLASEMGELHRGMTVKEEELSEMRNSKQMLEKEIMDLSTSKLCLSNRLEMALKEINRQEDLIKMQSVRLSEVDTERLALSEKVVQLNASFDSGLKLAQQEKELAVQHAQQKFDQIRNKYLCVSSERNSLQLRNDELHAKVLELQREQELVMVQHADECRVAKEKVHKLECEAETLLSKQHEMQGLISTLEDNAKTSLENSRTSDQNMKDLLMKLSELETESKGLTDGLKTDILKRQEKIDVLQKEIVKSEDKIGCLEKRISELENALGEKDRCVLELKSRETQYEAHLTEIKKSLADKETKIDEDKKQFDQILASQKSELSKHLKEISQRNDQAINDIRKKYDAEKQYSVNLEKQKADKVVEHLEKQYEKKITEHREEYQTHLLQIKEENKATIIRIQQDHNQKEMSLVLKHKEELKQIEMQAENKLREKSLSLRAEHEYQLRALRCEHEDECRRLQEELDNRKAKEERQRALLELQRKVMGDNREKDQQHYSISSTDDDDVRNRHVVGRTEVAEKNFPFQKAAQMLTSTLLRKDSKKVTHREYGTEPSNSRSNKRKKTGSSFMLEDPINLRKSKTPNAKARKHVNQVSIL